jgi:GNAT superfamily N-acetyltransferase
MTAALRTGEDFDLAAVGALHHGSRRAAYAGIVSPEALDRVPAGALAAWWTERLRWERETHRLTVAEVDGELAGFTYLGPSETPGCAELYAIHVRPSLVGTGVGRLLMANALPQLADLGAERAVLWVLAANERARRFYDRGGWVPDGGTRVEAINGEPVSQMRYTRPLVPSRRLGLAVRVSSSDEEVGR